MKLLPHDALDGLTVAMSVSDSADIARLGLSHQHVEFTVAEIARAVLTSGGTLIYGGRLKPPGFTAFLMHELRRYGMRGKRLTLVQAFPEHRRLPVDFLDSLMSELGPSCRVRFLDEDGEETDYKAGRGADPEEIADRERAAEGYSAMRKFIAGHSNAQVLVGGKTAGFAGRLPGILEEAIYALQASHPVVVAGGFGGAAALVVKELNLCDQEWLPEGLPEVDWTDERIKNALAHLRDAASTGESSLNMGLSPADRDQLAWSHRPSDIAALVATSLASSASPGAP